MKQTNVLNVAILILSIAASFIIGLNVNLAKENNKPVITPESLRAYQLDFKIDTLPPYGLRDSLVIYDGDRLVGTIPFSENKGIPIDSLLMSDNE